MIPAWFFRQGCVLILLISVANVFCSEISPAGPLIRRSTYFGNLQVYDNNEWKNLTVSSLGIPEQKVLCRQLGDPADWTYYHNNGFPSTNHLSLDITCVGNETSLSKCPTVRKSFTQSNDRQIYLRCERLSFLLEYGNARDGLVVVSDSVHNYPVCVDNIFDGIMARTVCKSLGLNSSSPLVMYPNIYKRRITRAIKLKLTCSENKTDCEFHTTNTNEFCEDSTGITYLTIGAVFCKDEALEYRLSKYDNETIGRLDVNISGAWGPVCDTANDIGFAQMACHAMGSPSTDARYYTGLYSGGDFGRQALNLEYCIPMKGSDSGFCKYSMIGNPCDNQGYLALSCANATEGQIRLLTHTTGTDSGTLQIYHDDEWLGIGVNSSEASALQVGYCGLQNSQHVYKWRRCDDQETNCRGVAE
ncbi:scavenger receptor cysteine-rich domain superfamily protein-like [Liolophura sinensis]|uniref:scavenger receptor cysteine-rich domain superfamily protein-like n=1 Tax=Liolophura sinensis TaxID=3198878 RepID=UPI00315805E3